MWCLFVLYMHDKQKIWGKEIGFGMKNCLPLPAFDWKLLNALRLKVDEAIFTYTDKYMTHSVKQWLKGGKAAASFSIMETIKQKLF